MSVQQGKDVLIKIDMNSSGSYETLAGLRTSRLSFNAEPIDVTNVASAGGWREILSGAAPKSASISGAGIFSNGNTDTRARTVFFNGTTPKFQIIIPTFGTIDGPFLITALEYSGEYSGEATYDMSMVSAGQLVFSEV